MSKCLFGRASFRGSYPCRLALGLYLLLALLGPDSSFPADIHSTIAFPPAATRTIDFVKDIQPVLAQHCYPCHGPEKQKADLRWDTKARVFRTGEHGPILVPGNSSVSRVIKLVAGLDPESVMPPRGERLSAAQIGLLRAWIDQGATWTEVPAAKGEDKRNHWAFKTPARPPLPAVRHQKWPRNPIDDFVLARLETEHLTPAAEADRTTHGHDRQSIPGFDD